MVAFNTLWNEHPIQKGVVNPCSSTTGNSNFANQCAIRMGVCLNDAGIDMSACNKVRCWFHNRSEHHILRAQELADWIRANDSEFGNVEVKSNVADSDYSGRTGIAFFKNFWGAGNQGDHIDLWDGSQMCHGQSGYFADSAEVWFWDIA